MAHVVPSHRFGQMWAKVLWTPCPCQLQICATALDGPPAKCATVAHLIPPEIQPHVISESRVWTPCPSPDQVFASVFRLQISWQCNSARQGYRTRPVIKGNLAVAGMVRDVMILSATVAHLIPPTDSASRCVGKLSLDTVSISRPGLHFGVSAAKILAMYLGEARMSDAARYQR